MLFKKLVLLSSMKLIETTLKLDIIEIVSDMKKWLKKNESLVTAVEGESKSDNRRS